MANGANTDFSNDSGTGTVGSDGQVNATFTSVSAAGSNSQSGSTAITKPITVVTTVATSTRGVRLPTPTVGAYYEVYNGSAKTMNVYPATGAAIGTAATNAAATLAANKGARYWAQSATLWRVVGP